MAKREQERKGGEKAEKQTWGTSEELLLACAVKRHGTERWESVAVEVQNRTPTLRSLTSQNCIDKFDDLKRRFTPQYGTDGTTANGMVDQLRRIRVEELRREVRHRDDSIVSLELKVKRLEAERDRSLKEEADLAREKNLSPAMIAGKSVSGIDSGYERSFDESNSTSQQNAETTMGKELNDISDMATNMKPEPEPENRNEPDHRLSRSDPEVERQLSHNGSIAEDGDDNNNNNHNHNHNDYGDEEPSGKEEIEMRRSPTVRIGESNELGESVGESKREDREKERQNSDVQSSAGLSLKKRKRRRRGRGGDTREKGGGAGIGSSSGEEPEVSPATKRLSAVKSEPLIKLLGTIRSNRLGSVFERRLKSQESERYKNLVRQHVDLQTVQSGIEEGVYSNCIQKFFKDLLLLFNNAIIFFGRNSPEFLAALELRAIVRKEMAEWPHRATVKTEPDRQKPAPNMKPIMIVCSKRTSGRRPSDNASKRGDKKDARVGEKPKVREKKIETSLVKNSNRDSRSKRSRETSVSIPGNARESNKNDKDAQRQFGGNELSSHDNFVMKSDRRESAGRKRQGAASFLKRMKQNSPSEVTDNDDDSSEDESKIGRGNVKEDVKKGGKDGDGIREVITRSSRARSAKEESEKPKRIGRPPKRQAAESVVVKGKRGRNGIDSVVGGGGAGRTRKRPRR